MANNSSVHRLSSYLLKMALKFTFVYKAMICLKWRKCGTNTRVFGKHPMLSRFYYSSYFHSFIRGKWIFPLLHESTVSYRYGKKLYRGFFFAYVYIYMYVYIYIFLFYLSNTFKHSFFLYHSVSVPFICVTIMVTKK